MSVAVPMIMAMVVMVAVVMVSSLRGKVTIGGVVGMAVKGPFEEKHQKEPRQDPGGCCVDVAAQFIEGVRQKVQQADTQHHAGGEREQHLHPPVAE